MLNAFECGRIKQAYVTHKSIAAAARATKHSRNTVAKLVKSGFAPPKYKKRRPNTRIVTRRKALVALANQTVRKQHRVFPKFSSAKQLAAAVSRKTGERRLSSRQVARDLHAVGLKPYVRPRWPTRSPKDMRRRVAFAKKNKQIDWKKIVFSDESWLCCNERTGRIHWRPSRGDVLAIERKARWNIPSIMVWAAAGYNYKSDLIIFPAKRSHDGELRQFRLDAEGYIRRCLSSVVPHLIREKKIFQQDGARSHASKKVTAYLARKRVHLLEEWPPYSPDLNAIERIWHVLQSRVGARCPMTVEELTTVAIEEWKNIPMNVVNAQCSHLPTQLRKLCTVKS